LQKFEAMKWMGDYVSIRSSTSYPNTI